MAKDDALGFLGMAARPFKDIVQAGEKSLIFDDGPPGQLTENGGFDVPFPSDRTYPRKGLVMSAIEPLRSEKFPFRLLHVLSGPIQGIAASAKRMGAQDSKNECQHGEDRLTAPRFSHFTVT